MKFIECPFCGDPVVAAPTSGNREPVPDRPGVFGPLFDEQPRPEGRWRWMPESGMMRRLPREFFLEEHGLAPHELYCRRWGERTEEKPPAAGLELPPLRLVAS